MLNVLRRLLENWPLQVEMLREVRFPYLDLDFLEFMYAVPREQIVGVGKRRFLMKRAPNRYCPGRSPQQKAKGVCSARVQKSRRKTARRNGPAWWN